MDLCSLCVTCIYVQCNCKCKQKKTPGNRCREKGKPAQDSYTSSDEIYTGFTLSCLAMHFCGLEKSNNILIFISTGMHITSAEQYWTCKAFRNCCNFNIGPVVHCLASCGILGCLEIVTLFCATSFQGFPTRMVNLFYIPCLRYTSLVGNPQCHSSTISCLNSQAQNPLLLTTVSVPWWSVSVVPLFSNRHEVFFSFIS